MLASGFYRIRFLPIVIASALFVACNDTSEVYLLGIPSVDSSGVLSLQECQTNMRYRLGPISANPEFHFLAKIEDYNIREPLVVDVMASISPENPRQLINPRIVNLGTAECVVANAQKVVKIDIANKYREP